MKLRIIVEQPPAGVDYGLQKGHGSAYETVQTQRSSCGDLQFDFEADLRAGNPPDFSGPFVQGPRGQRFVYIDIGTCAGQMDTPWSRRMKVPLAGITTAMAGSSQIIEARVPGTGRDGGPSCATVKDFDGWKVKGR